mmetsp:Transcript_26893/g.57626  ORF Transcript_26893/g.57626 Transcript_26893/m.57626 type:complete len:106 (-) Transcript_26893:12-329(-)
MQALSVIAQGVASTFRQPAPAPATKRRRKKRKNKKRHSHHDKKEQDKKDEDNKNEEDHPSPVRHCCQSAPHQYCWQMRRAAVTAAALVAAAPAIVRDLTNFNSFS